jgi:diguanylate cyclase (GGDEF)-like protein
MVVLSLLWEFWLEDCLGSYLIPGFTPETPAVRMEFVISVGTFSLFALLGPAWFGRRVILRNELLQAEVERLSREDDLTGLYNRRQLSELLKQEIRRFERYADPFVVISLDLDFFKGVNDRFGHSEGDRALVAVAKVLRSAVRASDSVGRWGGEEFMIICPATELAGGLQLAEKVRRRVAEFDFGRASPLTLSLGVAEFIAGDDLERVVVRADRALYAAKGKGRNRVESA